MCSSGSMSIVGVSLADYHGKPVAEASGFLSLTGQKDTRTEVVKGTVAKGNAFENLDFVVAAFGKTIGVWTVKSIENVRFPIFQNRKTGTEFGNISNLCMSPEFQELLLGLCTAC